MSMEGGVVKHDTSEFNTSEVELDISSISDKSAHGVLLKLKCEYIRHIQLLDEHTDNTDVLNSSSDNVDFLLDNQLIKTMNKSLKKAQISDLYLALLTHVRPLCVSSYSADDKLKVLPQEEQIQLVVTKVDNLVTNCSNFDLSDIQEKLSTLQSSVDDLKSQRLSDQMVSDDDSAGKSPYNNAADSNNHDFNDKTIRGAILKILILYHGFSYNTASYLY